MAVNRKALEEQQKTPVDGPGRERVLSEQEVRDILLDPRVMREIAEDYEISRSLVARIKDRTASYFQTRGFERGSWEPNLSLATLPVVVASSGHPTVLEEADVEKILSDGRTLKEIALDMNVSVSTIWRVRNRQYQGRSKDFQRPRNIIAKLDNRLILEE